MATVGVVAIAESHVGGITVSMGWAFVSGQGSSIRKYSLTALRDAMKAAGTPYLTQVGTARDVAASSFIGSYGNSLFSGSFNETGLTVTGSHFIYSTSYGRTNRSNVYVVKRGQKDLDAAALSCFRAPSMTEGITEYNGTAYLVYESASHLYGSDPNTLNVIPRLHKVDVPGALAA